VLGLAFLKLLHYWMIPVMAAAEAALLVIVSPLRFFLN
jgi:hypothetical protein